MVSVFVMDDLGRLGRVWHETDPDNTERETVIRDLLDGQYSNPVRVVAFNTAEGWSRDASGDIADALRRALRAGTARAAGWPRGIPEPLRSPRARS
jgi:hypothetical protein